MRGWRGVLGGILTLSVIYVVTDVGAAGRLGGLFTDVSKLIAAGMKRVSDPSPAGLKDYRQGGTARTEPTTSISGRPPRTGRQMSRPGRPVAQ